MTEINNPVVLYHDSHMDYNHPNITTSYQNEQDELFYYSIMIVSIIMIPFYLFLLCFLSYKFCIKPRRRRQLSVVMGTLTHHSITEENENSLISMN